MHHDGVERDVPRVTVSKAHAEADRPPAPADALRRVIVERVQPEIDGGRFPIKRTPGESVNVTADIFADGHDLDRKSTRLNSSHVSESRMPSSA